MRKYIFAIVMLSIAIKVIFLYASGVLGATQTYEYELVAKNLLKGAGFFYDHFGTKYYSGIAPGYPYLCYLVYKLFGHHALPVIFIQILVSSFLVVPIYLIARRIFNEQIAILASILCAIQPQLIVYSTSKLHSMNIYAVIFAVLVLSFLYLRDSLSTRNILFSGFIAGLAVLFRVTSLGVVFLGLVWFWLVADFSFKRKLQSASAILLILFVLILPWGIRNYKVLGKPLLLQTNKWETFWYGNMPGSSGALYTEKGTTIFEEGKKDLPLEFFKMDEIEQGNYLKRLTIGYFLDDPAGFVGKIFKKMYYFWYFSPYQGTLYPKLWLKLYKIYYLMILFAAALSLIYNFAAGKNFDRSAVLLIILLFLAITASHSLFFVEGRHRWSIESFVLIFSADGFRKILFTAKKALS